MKNEDTLSVIGWREHVSLPRWGIRKVRAKIDTGAKTSAIHVREIIKLKSGRIRFEVVTRERPKRTIIWVTATPVRNSVVKPSHGKTQSRIVCRTEMCIGPASHMVEISLVCRKGMLCRMLVGRTAIEGRYIVDPSKRYLLKKEKKKKVPEGRKKKK